MPSKFNPFNFEHRLFMRMEYLSSISESLPAVPVKKRSDRMLFVDLAEPLDSKLESDRVAANEGSQSPGGSTTQFDLLQTAVHRIECAAGDIWLRGTTLLCACPDCRAPMTIRVWLALADCWRCQTSLELTEQQRAAAVDLQERVAAENFGAKIASDSLPVPPTKQRRLGLPAFPPAPVVTPTLDPRQQELERLTRGSHMANLVRNGFRLTPAWLVSLLLHLIAILILALIVLREGDLLPEKITLSTFLSSAREAGGQIRMENPMDLLQDDLELASQMEAGDQELRDVLEKASVDARELVVDPRPLASMVDVSVVKRNITNRPDDLMSFAARDPRVRAEIVAKEGGTTITEAAVARGLRWLVSVQNRDGSWSLDGYHKHDRPKNQGDIMGTSLALLPLLGAGQTHEYGVYKENVAAGLAWLIDNQTANGDLRAGYKGQAGMYAHGQAAIVLCEALALTGDQRFLDPAQRAILFIEFAQHGSGGWRYEPGQAGDTSVFGWQMMALQSARAANLNLKVDGSTLKLADYFLDQVAAPARFNDRNRTPLPDGSAYCYQHGRPATPAMTAEAILCRMYLGWKRGDPRLSSAIKWLVTEHLPNADNKNLYYWYYGTQVMHHYGGEPWQIWNNKMRELLIGSQETRGLYAGSWNPKEYEWGNRGGRIYTTSLACCTLEVYYRHLPLFKRIELD